ncbi:hypothetical protein PV416_32255 [Streptomyces ipomoeae]|jgi:hypothetical protein|uniref:Uncharacterized protein n=1 Tax=Streptomyces ipomoeae 91-03 TaxID=698759 RepID=L1L815_9ACTN|nr:hypothetical protein [Streptomyces ipomoeae]EKX68939.1 hypothetical protein STRIP9103_06994 [Streptomyces ipomoeae 91-03]MDX2698379.1 hypothetical protein [Streptomyces ipomoeae]MDX2825622.1 hypothetical protein [Streptomyces ipomoeae]MDX2843980.1 hypothetical protein [Streptomyces ipomoeae]MDX2878277.1 hypothetical protein [Streptomyces ipomoeae]
MGTKTADETGAGTGAEAKNDAEAKTDESTVDVTKADTESAEAEADGTEAVAADAESAVEDGDEVPEASVKEPSGVGQGAGAVVSAALAVVSLTGSWVGTVASARETITGQLEMQAATNASVATQLQTVYGDAWQATALWNGVFALVALLVGFAVLARPAFGAPGKPQPVWIKSVSWAGISLAVVGLFLAVLKYTDVWLSLPSVS